MKNSESFIKQIFQLGIGAIVNLIIGLLTTPIITRLVDPAEYGQLNLFNTFSSIALMIFTLGLDQTFVRYYYAENSEKHKKKLLNFCFGLPIIFAVFGSIILLIVHFNIHNLFGFDNYIIWLFIANIFILILNRFGMLVLRLQYKTAMYSCMNILHKALYVIIAVPFIYYFDNNYIYILIFATLVSVLISALICVISERRFWFERVTDYSRNYSYKELVKFGFPLMIASGIFVLFQATDRLCIKYYGSYSDVGVYSSAQTLMSVFSIIQSTFNTLWAPKAIDHYESNPTDRSFYSRMNQIITVLMFLFGACVLLGKDLFVLLLGEKYRAASTIIPFLLFNPIMYTISETTVSGLAITKHTNSQVLITAVSATINLIGNMLLVPVLGPKGAAVSTGFAYIVFFTMRTMISHYYFPVEYQLKKHYLITAIFAVSCYYHMFHSFDYIIVILFVGTVGSVGLLYWDTVLEIVNIAKKHLIKPND